MVAILLLRLKNPEKEAMLLNKLKVRKDLKGPKSSGVDNLWNRLGYNKAVIGIIYEMWVNVFESDLLWRGLFSEQLMMRGFLAWGDPEEIISSIICWDVPSKILPIRRKQLYRKLDPGNQVLISIFKKASEAGVSDVIRGVSPSEVLSVATVSEEDWLMSSTGRTDLGFSKEDHRLMKWRVDKFRSKFSHSWKTGGKWRSLLSVLVESMSKDLRSRAAMLINCLFYHVPDDCVLGEAGMMAVLKELTTLLKRDIPQYLNGFVGYFVDLSQLGGYDTVLNHDETLYSTWVSAFEDASIRMRDKSRAVEVEKLSNYVRHVVRGWGIKKWKVYEPVSGEDFIMDRGGWAIPGASTLKGMEVEVKLEDRRGFSQRKKVKVGGKEFSTFPFSDQQLWSYATKDGGSGEEAFPFQKGDEAGKGRIVVNHDIRSYLRCGFLQSFMSVSPEWTALDKGDKGNLELHERLANLLEGGKVGVSLDFSGWDHSVCVDLVIIVLKEVGRFIMDGIVRYCPFPEVKKRALIDIQTAVDSEINSLMTIKYTMPDGTSPRYNGGFLSSGHKWTAFANTILNRALFLFTVDKIGARDLVLDSVHQGDDIGVILGTQDVAVGEAFTRKFSESVGGLGFTINPLKTSIAQGGVEFLRYWITPDGSFGYPGRMLKTMIWRKPNVDMGKINDWLMKINETVENAKVAERRGVTNVGWITRRVIRGIVPSAISKIDRQQLDRWLATPVALGGLEAPGFRSGGSFNKPITRVPRLIKQSKVHILSVTSLETRLHGDRELKQKGSRLKHYSHMDMRLEDLLATSVPMTGFSVSLKWERVASITECRELTQKVRTGRRAGGVESDIPSIYPTEDDGPGWWMMGILGRHALRDYLEGNEDAHWEPFLSSEFKEFCSRVGVTPNPKAIRWAEMNLQPPAAGLFFEERELWKERISLKEEWAVFYAYGLLQAKGSERRTIEYGVKQLMKFS